MSHLILGHVAIQADLSTRVRRLGEAHHWMYGTSASTDVSYMTAAWWSTALAGEIAEMAGDLAATRVAAHLVHPLELGTSEFWRTALGRAIGWWTGGAEADIGDGVPVATAAAIMGMTRQGVDYARRRGHLAPKGLGVDSASVANYMRTTFPWEV